MEKIKTLYPPFVRKNDSTVKVMTDVIWALLPCLVMSYLAFRFAPIAVILVSVISAVIAELLFGAIFYKSTRSVHDGSAIVTGMLLAFTIGPFTPLYVVAIGGATAVIFGKLLCGGIGRNRFNPALVGREFITVFFPLIMNSRAIWFNKEHVNFNEINIFNNTLLDHLFFNPVGAIGEYSVIFLVLGGLFLLLRRRISWHIPVSYMAIFSIMLIIFSSYDIRFSFGGVFLGTIYMATDMPTSTSTNGGKIYYGALIAILCIFFILNDIVHGYFSYAILLMNGFVHPLNWVFRTNPWGRKYNLPNRFFQGVLITGAIFFLAYIIILLHHADMIIYLVIIYILYSVTKFIRIRYRKA